MAPQRQGSQDEDSEVRPKLATTLQGSTAGGTPSGTEVGETAAAKSASALLLLQEEGRGGAVEGGLVSQVDDELTNLTWLQNCNLLQGIQRQVESSDRPVSPPPKVGGKGAGTAAGASQSDEFYNPTVHRHAKPPYSFSCLIFMAIEDSPSKALPVKDIYNWIFSHFPYFRNAPNGWRNSIRHNLSLSKCFYKVDKGQNIAKGSLWCVDPKYRHHLLHSLNKTPNAHYQQGVRLPTYNPLPLLPNHQRDQEQQQQQQAITSAATNQGPNPNLFPYLSKRLAASNTKNQEEDAAATMLALKNGSAFDSSKIKKPKVAPKETEASDESESYSRTKDDARVRCRFLLPLSLCMPITTSRPSKDHTYSTTGESEDEIMEEEEEVDEELEEEEEEEEEQPLELTTKRRSVVETSSTVKDNNNKWRRKEEHVIVNVRDELRRRKRLDEEEQVPAGGKYLRRRRSETGAAVASSRLEVLKDEEQKIVDGADALLNLAGILTTGGKMETPQLLEKTVERPARRQRKPNRTNLRHLVR